MQVLTKKFPKNSIRSSRRHGIINIHSKTTKNQPTQDLPKISGFLHFSGLLLHLDPAPHWRRRCFGPCHSLGELKLATYACQQFLTKLLLYKT